MSVLNKKGKRPSRTGAPIFWEPPVAVSARTMSAGDHARGEVDPDVLVGAWMAGNWAKKNPETIKNFRAAIDEGLVFIKANPDEAKEIERKYIGFNTLATG